MRAGPSPRISTFLLAWSLALATACTGAGRVAPGEPADGGSPEDASAPWDGSQVEMDAAPPVDAAAPPDAGAAGDGGTPDAVRPPDAGAADAFRPDAAPLPDAAAPPDAAVPPDAGSEPVSVRIRVVAGNITSGNYQSYDPGHGIRIFQGLDPDVVLIQEFNYGDNTTADLRAMVDQAFGAEFSYYREPRGSIPNGVISRWPILQSGRWEDVDVSNRGFAWARIDIPGSRDLWAVSIHLLTSSSGDRSREAGHLVQFIERDVPGSAFLVVGGDLNTDSRTESCISTLRRVVTTQGTPVDQDGNPGTNRSRSKPYDWVLPDADLDGFRVPVTLGTNTFPNGLVFDSRVYTPLADVSPVRREDSDAPQMQHMAVVKDFLVREP